MNKNIFLGFWVFANFLICAAESPAPSSSSISTTLKKFETYVQNSLQKWKDPGMAIVVVQDGKIKFLKTFGVESVHTQKPVTPHTLFSIASLSKNFTATLVMKLVQEKKIDLDKPVVYYLPHFQLSVPSEAKRLTVRHILHHAVGLKNYSGDAFWYLGFDWPHCQKALAKIPLDYPVGEQYAYQNLFYQVLGDIIEKVTGRSYETNLREKILNPIEIYHAQIGCSNSQSQGIWQRLTTQFKKWFSQSSQNEISIASPHDQDENEKIREQKLNPIINELKSSSGILISAEEMAHWLIFHLNKGCWKEKSIVDWAFLKLMQNPQIQVFASEDDYRFHHTRMVDTKKSIHYGFGWFMYDYGIQNQRVRIFTHLGGLSGSRALITVIPHWNLGIAILSNLGAIRVSLHPEALHNWLLDHLLELPDEKDWSQLSLENKKRHRQKQKAWFLRHKLLSLKSSGSLDDFVGSYENAIYGTVQIIQDHNQLILEYTSEKSGTKRVPLHHWNGNEFYFDSSQLAQAYAGIDRGFVTFGFHTKSHQKAMIWNFIGETDELFLAKKSLPNQ
jgi:CubicO group peptidase (beta-lactamase class C family)